MPSSIRTDYRRKRVERGLCADCDNYPPQEGLMNCVVCSEESRARNRLVKQQAMDAYGGCCMCCGIKELVFLAIDHIDGGGNQHRKRLRINNMYLWLRKEGYPEGFQVLCHNCNFAKRLGKCPHKEG